MNYRYREREPGRKFLNEFKRPTFRLVNTDLPSKIPNPQTVERLRQPFIPLGNTAYREEPINLPGVKGVYPFEEQGSELVIKFREQVPGKQEPGVITIVSTQPAEQGKKLSIKGKEQFPGRETQNEKTESIDLDGRNDVYILNTNLEVDPNDSNTLIRRGKPDKKPEVISGYKPQGEKNPIYELRHAAQIPDENKLTKGARELLTRVTERLDRRFAFTLPDGTPMTDAEKRIIIANAQAESTQNLLLADAMKDMPYQYQGVRMMLLIEGLGLRDRALEALAALKEDKAVAEADPVGEAEAGLRAQAAFSPVRQAEEVLRQQEIQALEANFKPDMPPGYRRNTPRSPGQ